MPPLNHLVVVCCHGIWTGGAARGFDESEWLIASFQAGETPTFIEHIKAGLKCLKSDPAALLVFSGGPTRQETRLSEAQSYLNLAKENEYFGLITEKDAADRIALDEQALDSYHNVLYGLIAHWRHGSPRAWPMKITIISHEFKRERIVDGHCAAIGFPLDRVELLGIDPPSMIPSAQGEVPKTGAMVGVIEAVDQWREDPHGTGALLAGKRKKRNPWSVDQNLFRSDEERLASGLETANSEDGEHISDSGSKRPWA